MITLFKPMPVWGLPSMSPYACKLETYFRMTKIEYKARGADFRKAPNNRVPYVDFDGQIMGDSTLIIRRLKEKFGDPLDGKLTSEQKAQAHAIRALFEDHLFFAMAYLRWSQDPSWKYVREVFKPLMPPLVGGVIVKYIRKSFLGELAKQGMGEHPASEIIAFAKTGLNSVSGLLGDKPFFLGEEPTSIDATAYGFLIQVMWVPWESEVVQYARSLPNLVSYCERMKKRYWS